MDRPLLSVMVVGAILITPALAQEKRVADVPLSRVKTCTRGLAGARWVKGIVDKIDADGLTLVETVEKTGEVREVVYAPTDVLREGEIMDHASGRFSYRWQDVKRGDTVELEVNLDRVDKVMYCVEICIKRRPKGKLPECQKPKEYEQFPQASMFNDIDNGEDVSDDEIKKLFPPRPESDDGTGIKTPAYPGGLPKEYQAKLDVIRAKKKEAEKKEQELKAKPPEKK